MAGITLDQEILDKLVKKTGRPKDSLRQSISHRAAKENVSSQTSEIRLAREHGIATGRFFRSLPPHIQQEVREATSTSGDGRRPRTGRTPTSTNGSRPRRSDAVKGAVDQLLCDAQLRRRCGDLLKGRGPYDRVIREATTILDHRLQKLGGITGYMKPVDVVGKVVNSDPDKAIVKLSDERAEQEGFHNICKGLTLAFRGPRHHALSDDLTRADALKFCGFVDILLGAIGKAKIKIPDTGEPRPS